MKRFFRGGLSVVVVAAMLSGCGNKQTKDALHAAQVLEDQQQYQDANDILLEALRKREEEIRSKLPLPADQQAVDDLTKKVRGDSEILKMERAQIPVYLHLDRPDLASAVYTDIEGGDPDDTAVFDMLKDKDAGIRAGAVRVLALAGKANAIDALGGAIKDPDKDVRRGAVAALGTIKDPKVVPPLIEALKDSFWFARSDAADALGRESDARAIDPLFGLVNDPDKTAQSSAENALLAIAVSRGISGDAYAARLNDPNAKVVLVAAVCLAAQKDPRATPVVLRLADSTDPDAKLHAVKALGETGDATVIPTLRRLLHDPEINVRGWSVIGLAKLHDTGSVAELRAIAADEKESPKIRAAAGDAVNHILGTDHGGGASGL